MGVKNGCDPTKLTPKEALFVAEYLIDLNGAAAYTRAGYKTRYSNRCANALLAKPKVQKALQEASAKRLQRLDFKADDVLRSFSQIAATDRNELVELRRECCRYCYGHGHRYQYTASEMEAAKASHEAREAKKERHCLREDEAYEYTEFDEAGGIGFNPHKDPIPTCSECFGDGVTRTYFKDTRKLSDSAKAVYEGVKQTRGGLELIMSSRDKALDSLARHFALFNDKLKVEHDLSSLTDEELEQLEQIQRKIAESRSDPEGED